MTKYFTKSSLILANRLAIKRGYNRQLSAKISELDDDLKFPIVFSVLHEHAAGVRVDPHIRCIVALSPSHLVQVDCDSDVYNFLPSFET